MNYKKISLGLGYFSLALGALELLGARRIARTLDVPKRGNIVRAFGGREIAAGVGLIQSPAHAPRMWHRVLGDAMDLGALGLVARKSPGNRVALGALAVVAGATALDIWVARGLDRTTGRTLPARAAA
ncbi:hypothetical protein BSL82_06150 [Tardibacter chloracetimidivorans]|uniref:DUF4267 domain-containing protein n=1 Tax=Tardibacter chloracetimidivorans TaxID=1921510 RepID=A0A1L3ZTJ6_9SPHN|nr:hypothetical protein [Tardibacter chloracetimidivorans]API58945.1 hypothetical protein BSL82_06150 [Tardibacter chloracetimidivorans]